MQLIQRAGDGLHAHARPGAGARLPVLSWTRPIELLGGLSYFFQGGQTLQSSEADRFSGGEKFSRQWVGAVCACYFQNFPVVGDGCRESPRLCACAMRTPKTAAPNPADLGAKLPQITSFSR